MNQRRLFVVANRLPVQISGEKEQATILPVSGGLVSAIQSYLQHSDTNYSEVLWAGVPGCSPTTWVEAEKKLTITTFRLLPVLVYKEQYDLYYNGFSNSVLWPLFHYFPSFAEYNPKEFESYLQVNEHFADVLLKQLRKGDTVWIHDYHLLPLAGMIRKAAPEVSIGFFLHIPFPSYEIFRMMPRKWQEVLLDGVLGADLVGFHTMDYASHFLECVQKAIGVENDRNIIRYKDRLISIGVFPISVDYASFNAAYNQPEVENIRSSLRQQWSNVKMIFSVDRLDYTKGVRNRLKAYNQFLQQYPEYKEKVVFIMTIVPSRDNIPRYVERKKMIDELISEINSQVATLHWQPIVYRYNSLSREELIALYTACDLALITPLRDGMNLVAKEFVASRKDQRGVLVISEMAGAAKELSAALLINPNDINETATAIYKGLTMHEEEQRQRMSALQHRIAQYDIQAWAEDFMQSMEKIKKRQQTFQELFVDDLSRKNILERFRSSHQRLLLLDYDGTLVPFSSRPELAKPDKNLLCLLQQLSSREDTDVYVVSGRNSEWLDHVFQSIPLHLVAEHGAMKRKHGEKWQSEAPISGEWKERIEQIMQLYVLRCPNTFVEQKKFSVVWHYRNADPVQGKWNAHALMCELNEYLGANFLQVVSGNKIVEVKSRGIDKGTAVKRILAAGHYDFVLAAGDDKTDEDMFKALTGNEHSITIKIGPKASFAQYNLMRPAMLLTLLDNLNRLPIRKFVH